MSTPTMKLFAIAALVATTSLTAVGLTQSPAQADPMPVIDDGAGYSTARINAVFNVLAEMPATDAVAIPLAEKGDLLPIGCAGPFRAEVTAECLDTAYELASDDPSIVVETRVGDATSILIRMISYTIADTQNRTLEVQ